VDGLNTLLEVGMMTRLKRLVFAAAMVGMMGGCSSSTATTVTLPPNVAGSWNITRFQFVSVAAPGTSVDQITGGATATLTMTATAYTISSGGNNVLVGTYTETATTLVVHGTDAGGNAETLNFAFGLNGSTITMTGATTNHDFGSGQVPSYLNITATKM
jgi:hypothetical protein